MTGFLAEAGQLSRHSIFHGTSSTFNHNEDSIHTLSLSNPSLTGLESWVLGAGGSEEGGLSAMLCEG